ncbi:unnamed protein product [Haemonchus placei]|uniref:Uncharacterized protein n=1 Tax=Haemonchus placei TaxID=6290 RepID=A0A0N4X131_HAEPC|nr:unnamed protein product [Haemonchus placei]
MALFSVEERPDAVELIPEKANHSSPTPFQYAFCTTLARQRKHTGELSPTADGYDSEKAKSIYRSVVIISLSVVLGYFSSMIILSVRGAFSLNIEPFYLTLFAGLFANVAFSVNFFVYYGISKEYRGIFDSLLGIGHLKALLGRAKPGGVQLKDFLPSRSPNRITTTHAS